MARNKEGLEKSIKDIQQLRKEFKTTVKVPGNDKGMNVELEKALRTEDFLELGELMARDALERAESCGGHFREEFVTEDGEAKRDDVNFAHASAWEFKGEPSEAVLHKEKLEFNDIELKTRSYK